LANVAEFEYQCAKYTLDLVAKPTEWGYENDSFYFRPNLTKKYAYDRYLGIKDYYLQPYYQAEWPEGNLKVTPLSLLGYNFLGRQLHNLSEVNLSSASRKTAETNLKIQQARISLFKRAYYLDNNSYPSSINDLVSMYRLSEIPVNPVTGQEMGLE